MYSSSLVWMFFAMPLMGDGGIRTQDCWMKVKRLIHGATGWFGTKKIIQLQQFLVCLLVKPTGDPPCNGSRVEKIDPSPFPGRMS